MDGRRFTDDELERLYDASLKPVEGRGTTLALYICLRGTLDGIAGLEQAGALPESLVLYKAATEAIFASVQQALREGPYDGMTVA